MAKGPVAIAPSVAPPPVGNPWAKPKAPPDFKKGPKAKMPFPHHANKARLSKGTDPRKAEKKPKPPMTISQALQKGMQKSGKC